MWYEMPTGDLASQEAAMRDLRDRLEAIRCAATLIRRRGVGAQDRQLGLVIQEQLEFVETVLAHPGRFLLPAPRSLLERLR